jgi:hypothetical protein
MAITWALPWTLLGAIVGIFSLLGGGHMQCHGRVLEFFGTGPTWVLKTFPLVTGAGAVTLGHVVLARDLFTLEATRAHERIHVRQYERWGPLFVPAYFACWIYLMCRGRNPYFDNPFEREAFEKAP